MIPTRAAGSTQTITSSMSIKVAVSDSPKSAVRLMGISKRGNSYLRRLFVQGARVVMQYRTKQAPGLSHWLSQLMARTHQNVAVVALANKLLRMAWAVLCKNETYRIPALATAP